ncbi:DUF72 domain-containing protein [Sphingomonas sp. 1P06PA]|uniref:DUF72 domain-containing protein n=1 Tax=Sphingomonas sp. 1P06PA TaxID=554121 RepID=UPI0039A4E059
MTQAGRIRVGIGGWTYEPWRGTFYPPKLPHARELEHAAGQVTAIEINGTFYGRQKPESFEKWAAAVPDDFQFSLKASRYAVNRKVLADAGESITRFLEQGITRLGPKLGPILWQFAATKQFDHDDFAAFLELLPPEQDGLALRHVVEPRHESFRDPRFIDLVRAHRVAVVIADGPGRPVIPDLTADFVYARLQDAQETIETGYSAEALDRWAGIARSWAAGHRPQGFDYVIPERPKTEPRNVFIFMINGAKVRAPAAAKALIERLPE